MAVYYVRISGSDSNAGTSPALAWRTITKALGTAGISSGDTLYIGAGIYREAITVTMTTAVQETFIIGDVDGIYTGDTGEIVLTIFLRDDSTTVVNNNSTLNIAAKNYLTFKNLTIEGGRSAAIVSSGTNIKIINCNIINTTASNVNIFTFTIFGTNANIVLDSCVFFGFTGGTIIFTKHLTNDYNANIKITNCIFLSSGIILSSTGANSFFGGGVIISNCFFLSSTVQISSSTSIIYPCYVFNSFIHGAVALNSNRVGQLIENHNRLYASSSSRTNVPIGLNSIGSLNMPLRLNLNFAKIKNLFSSNSNYIHNNLGNTILSTEQDLKGVSFPIGSIKLLFEGSLTSVSNTTLTDSSKQFGNSNNLIGNSIKMLNGPAQGCIKTLYGNNNTTLSGDGLWPYPPDINNKYIIYKGGKALRSKISTGSSQTIRDNYAQWEINMWQGYTCEIVSGNASGQNFIVSGNSTNTLTGYYPLSIIPSSGNVYNLYWGAILKGSVSTGTNYTLTDNTANWPISSLTYPSGFWYGKRCMIINGNASGTNFAISGSTENTLSGWNSFSIIPNSGSNYVIYDNTGEYTGYYPSGYVPMYNIDFIHCAASCFQIYDTAIKETGIVLSGANSIRLFGPGIQDFQVPISGITTLSVFGYYDDYYLGTNPQLKILNGSGIGIADNTATMLGASGQWEQLRLSFTGSSAGVITARLQSNCTNIGGSAYFDCWNIS